VAFEQRDAEVGLEVGDRLRERRLRDGSLRCSTSDLPLFGTVTK